MKLSRTLTFALVIILMAPFDLQFSAFAGQAARATFAPPIRPDPPGQNASANPQAPGQTAGTDDLKIVVIDGEDGINIIKKQTAVQPVVEVRDRNDQPVAGAAVVFTTPGMGPSGTFINGAHTFSVVTDSAGRAAVTGMKPTGTGTFKITVTARSNGRTGTTVISQNNILKAAGATAGTVAGISAAHWAIIGGIAAAAAVGTVVAVNHNSSGTPTGTIGAAGTPSITTPH